MNERRVVRADCSEAVALLSMGWVEIARSWAAELTVDDECVDRLALLARPSGADVSCRELEIADRSAVLALDRGTLGDYPGDVATRHEPLTAVTATPSARHRGWGAFAGDGLLCAMTFVEIPVGSGAVETAFTVVRRGWRGRGLGTAVKATSLLALLLGGRTRFRTGGAVDNRASIRMNETLGYIRDEEWVTLARRA